jgi:hypothetical protein
MARAHLETESKANWRELACFKTGSHILRVETGRCSYEAQNGRTSAILENECHFVYDYPGGIPVQDEGGLKSHGS